MECGQEDWLTLESNGSAVVVCPPMWWCRQLPSAGVGATQRCVPIAQPAGDGADASPEMARLASDPAGDAGG